MIPKLIVFLFSATLIVSACAANPSHATLEIRTTSSLRPVTSQGQQSATDGVVLRGPATPTITPEAFTIQPTLTESEIQAFLPTLAQTNLGCKLPCLWGITVGKTQFATAKSFVESFSGIGSSAGTAGYENSVDLADYSLGIAISISPRRGVIEKIYVSFVGSKLTEYVDYFSFAELVNELGEPSEILVYVATQSGEVERAEGTFELLVFYKDDGVLLRFIGNARRNGGNYQICPGKPNFESAIVEPGSGNIDIFIGNPKTGRVAKQFGSTFLAPALCLQISR